MQLNNQSTTTPDTDSNARDPLVSIVIPLYNKQDHVAATLDSVFAQEFRDFEVIVINDGSTDDSEAAVRPFLDRIRFIRQANTGPGAARNRGIELSRGRYLAFLDADDVWRPGKLREQVGFLHQHPDVMWCGCNVTFENTKPGDASTAVSIPRGLSSWVIFDDWFSASLDKALSQTPCMVVHREVFGRVGMFDPTIPAGQDMDLWIRIATHFRRFAYCYQPLVHVNNWLPGCVSRNGDSKYRSMLAFTITHIEQTRAHDELDQPVGRYLRRKLLALIGLSLAFGHVSVAREAIRKTPDTWRGNDWRKFWLICLLPAFAIRALVAIRSRIVAGVRARRVAREHERLSRIADAECAPETRDTP